MRTELTALEEILPITDTVAPANAAELSGLIRDAIVNQSAIYPVGGATSLDYGLPAKQSGVAVSLAEMAGVIDYPARDMTITVKAGTTMRDLAAVLAAENQRLPIDVPIPEQATVGGVIATAWSGPRRYAEGGMRDYLIGVSAVDGHGTVFKSGGRVVKNVAGYDLCKLLTGSLGTVAIVTQATLKVRPLPETTALLGFVPASTESLEPMLAALAMSQTAATAIELLSGPEWESNPHVAAALPADGALVLVGLEGSRPEVDWMIEQVQRDLQSHAGAAALQLRDAETTSLWQELASWSAQGHSPLVLQATVLPSGVADMCHTLQSIDASCSLQAHAGNGVIIAKLSEFPPDGLSRTLLSRVQPKATSLQGNVIVLSNPSGRETTRQSVWGGIGIPWDLMTAVKQQLDPGDVLNPGRFVYLESSA